MSLSRERCTVIQPGELLSRLPTVIKTYSQKPGSLAKCRSNDSPFITSALPQDLHHTTGATKSNHNDLRAAGESPKGPVSKPICLSLVPKQVHSLTQELIDNKAKNIKDGPVGGRSKRRRRASVHIINPVKIYKESFSDIETDSSAEVTLGPKDDLVSPAEDESRNSNLAPITGDTGAWKPLSRIRRNVKLPVRDSVGVFRFLNVPFNSTKKAFADWTSDSALMSLSEPSKMKCVRPPRKKAKRADPKGLGSSGLTAMSKPLGSIETFSSPREQESLIYPEEMTPSHHENIQDPILLEDYKYATGSKGDPISKLSQVLDNRDFTEQIRRLTISSQQSKDHRGSQALQQIKQVLAPQHLLLRSKKVRNLTDIDGDFPSIIKYDERNDWDRRKKASFVNAVFPNVKTDTILPNERVSHADSGDKSNHLEEPSNPVGIQNSTPKPLDCGLHGPIPEFYNPLRQLKCSAEFKRTNISQTEVNESASLRTSISIKARSRNSQQTGDQACHVTITSSKAIHIDILDESSLDSLNQPRHRLPGDANLDDLNSPQAKVGKLPDIRCECCAEIGSSPNFDPSKVPFDKPGPVAATPAPAPDFSFRPLRPSRIIEDSQGIPGGP
ncbi:hypothetical protein MMC29_003665 [Sticta canariensis]|nr:hypothetical protein [Sticta canariensis]